MTYSRALYVALALVLAGGGVMIASKIIGNGSPIVSREASKTIGNGSPIASNSSEILEANKFIGNGSPVDPNP